MLQRGFTLLESLLVISLVALLIQLSAPGFRYQIRQIALKQAATDAFFLLKRARILAITGPKPVRAVIKTGQNWCIGLTDEASCDCRKVSNCQIEGKELVISVHNAHTVQLDNTTFSGEDITEFDAMQGRAFGHAGTVNFSTHDTQLKVIVNNLGRIKICVALGTLGHYPSC